MRSLTLALLLASFSLAALGQIKKPEAPPVKIPFAQSRQAVVVTTKNWTATQGIARRYERASTAAAWKTVGDSFAVVVGRSGLGMTGEDKWQIGQATRDGLIKR